MPCLSFEGKRVYLACGATDMRKSFNGLAAIVEAYVAMPEGTRDRKLALESLAMCNELFALERGLSKMKPEAYLRFLLETVPSKPISELPKLLPWGKSVPESVRAGKRSGSR